VAVALFDWDGTLRPGFTTRAWVRLLVRRRQFALPPLVRLAALERRYRGGGLAYDDFADLAALAYAQGVAGHETARARDLARRFVAADRGIPGFVRPLLDLLHDRGLRVVVVSGTPQVVLDEYADRLGIDAVHGLEVEEDGGRWRPSLRANPGTRAGKAERVATVDDVVLAAGNDEVDAPLLEAARIRFRVGAAPGTWPEGTTDVDAGTILAAVAAALDAWVD
jgi:phosphoserine phosphatase